MKLKLHLRNFLLTMLLINYHLIVCGEIISNAKLSKSRLQSQIESERGFSNPNNFRFSSASDKNKEITESTEESIQNVFTINTELLISKPPISQADDEQEIWPANAESGTYYKRGFWFWTWVNRHPNNAINRFYHSFWRSENNRKEDFWQANFRDITKFDSMEIVWHRPPVEFRVEFSVEDKGAWIPLIEPKKKFIPIIGGVTMEKKNVPYNDVLIFHKPVFAKFIKISMKTPLYGNYFSIYRVKFYNKKSVVMIYNQTFNSCKNFCFYVNTSLPRVGSKLEAMDCLQGMSTGDNRELFYFARDRSLRLFNNPELCVGRNSAKEIVLYKCKKDEPPFRIQTRLDNSLYFETLEEYCIYINTQRDKSDNFIHQNMDLTVTSEYDRGSFKRENMLINTERYWMSIPGQQEVTVQLNLGLVDKKKNQWESKKIDFIIIEFTKPPKDFRILCWYPGSAWIMLKSFQGYSSYKMELKLQGIKCASIMINFLKGNTWPEFDHKVAYAIKSIEIGTYSYRLIHEKCKFVTNTIGKIEFDIDAQYYTKNPNIKAYTSQQAALIHNFQLMIKSYKTMKQNIDHVRKAHQTGSLLRQNLKTMEESIYNKSQKMVQDFEASKLLRPTNPNYEYYSNLFTRTNSIDEINISTDGAIGTSISNPAENCLRVIVINRSALSGFYWIKPDCALKPIKVWCDFSSYGDAVDILITSGERIEINPDLSEWNIRDYKTIQKKCAELGLYPIQIRSSDVISRIVDLAEFLNYDLTLPQVIPLGYDYFCDTSGCSGQFSSLDSEDSKPINSYFPEKDKDDANVKKKMSGIGFNHLKSMKIFDPIDTKITAIVCSTNISKPAHEEPQVEVDCDRTVTGHTDQFPSNNNVLINCDASCNLSPVEVYGDGVYDGKSSICKAAIHDGKITINGGKVNISVRDAMPDNAQFMTLVGAASQKNGIQSRKDVKNDGSFPFSFINYTPACPIDNFLDTHEKELDIKIKKDLGDSFLEMNENLLKDVNIDDLTEDELKTIFVKGKPMSYYKKLRDEMVSDPDNFRFSEEQFKPLDVPGKGGKKGLSELTANKPNMDKAVNQLKGNAENGLKNLMGQASQGAETSMSALQKGLQNTISETNKGVANAQYGMDQLSGAAVAAAKNMALDKVSQGVKQNWSEWGKMGKGLGNISFDDQVAIRRKIEQQDEGQNEENKPKKDGKDCTPTTDQGFEIIQEIFKASDYNMLNELENDRKKVEETIASFGKELAWTNKANGSSNFALKYEYSNCNLLKRDTNKMIRRALGKAEARVQKTFAMRYKLKKKLLTLSQYKTFSLDNKLDDVDSAFSVKNYKSLEDKEAPKWKIYREHIKGRVSALGLVGRYKPTFGMFGSFILVKKRNYYDATIYTDILMTGNGIAGVVFKFKDRFNFYAFVINTKDGYKAIVKVVAGKGTILEKIDDGGILINDWHRIVVHCISDTFKVEMHDVENKSYNKVLSTFDNTFTEGSIGFFSTDLDSVFFDKINVQSNTCWNPWKPREGIDVMSNTVNIHDEDFKGSFDKNWDGYDPANAENAPSKYKPNYSDNPEDFPGLNQGSRIYDPTPKKTPAMAIHKKPKLKNGILKTGFMPKDTPGTVSMIFKHNKKQTPQGEQEDFYSFDFVNNGEGQPGHYELRKFQDGIPNSLAVVNSVKNADGTDNYTIQPGYKPRSRVKALVEVDGQDIVVKVANDGGDLTKVLHYQDKNPLKGGSVGVGTYNTRVNFFNFATNPFKTILTPEMVSMYLNSDNERILPGISELPQDNMLVKRAEDRAMASSVVSVGSALTAEQQLACNSKVEKTFDGAIKCSTIITDKEKSEYCTKKYDSDKSILVCQERFCDVCCQNEEKLEAKKLKCVKSCQQSRYSSEKTDTFFDTCYRPLNSSENAYAYCDNIFKAKKNVGQQHFECKLDFCRLCCILRDHPFNQNHGLPSIEKCYGQCYKTFKPVDENR